MHKFTQSKLVNHLRQYGLRAGVSRIFRALIRKVYQLDRDIVFVIPGYEGFSFDDACIHPLTAERIDLADEAGELEAKDVRLLRSFLDQGCRGVCAEVDGRLAGYAWVQCEGEYRFGRVGRLTIPPKFAFAKNLFVSPNFRGRKLGQKLNAARLAMIPPGHTPVTFIIPENRFAIRNWEKYGFQRIVEVKNSRWFGGRWRTRVKRLSERSEADRLIRAIEEGNGG